MNFASSNLEVIKDIFFWITRTKNDVVVNGKHSPRFEPRKGGWAPQHRLEAGGKVPDAAKQDPKVLRQMHLSEQPLYVIRGG